MSDNTKSLLAEAFRQLMKEKPLNKIRVHDLTEKCGINRQSFYYHYKDIYDLLEDMVKNEILDAIGEYHTIDNWEIGMLAVYRKTLEDKELALYLYNGLAKDKIQLFLEDIFESYMKHALEETMGGSLLSESDRDIYMHFCTYGFTGTYLHWLQNGLLEDPEVIIDRLSVLTKEGLLFAITRSITVQNDKMEE